MKKYLIDTDVLIAHLRGGSGTQLRAERIEESVICYFSVGELLQGARNKREQRVLQSFLREFSIDWGSEAIHRKAVDLLVRYAPGSGLHMSDAIIAATAQVRKLQVVTANDKHFRAIKEIAVQTEWSP